MFKSFWKKKRFWQIFSVVVLMACVIVFVACYSYIRGLDVSKLSQPLPESTLVLDKNGKPASQLSASKIEPVQFSQLPKVLTDAVVSVEDRRFYEHTGIDMRSIFRAVARDVLRGSYSEGASTITQQLARNLFLNADKTLGRKLREAAYAIKIDTTYSKNEILEMYLNSIYFGEGSWGVQGAARTYFNKNVKDLTLPEAAVLAALPKAPSRYSPFNDEGQALERRNTVLVLMRDEGKITAQDYEKAKSSPLGVVKSDKGNELKGRYPAYVDAVINEAVHEYGFTEEQLLTGGLRITTELDPSVQNAVADVFKDESLFPESKPDQLIQSGAAIVDQRTGGIRALAGGRGEGVFRGFSRATQLKRQPGSSFKPIVVYGPALEKGYMPSSLLFDGPLNIEGYQPQDWDHQTRGQVTMQEAVVSSWNVPAVWLLHEIGIDRGLQFAKSLGITLPAQDRQLGIALGGLSEGVSPLQMAQAFSAFAAKGVLHQAHTITKIETSSGHLLVGASPKGTPVMQPETAYAMTTMLQVAVAQGTGKNAAMNRPVAGKSGTTQLPQTKEFEGLGSGSAKDAWFVGYTPELTAAVWVGYDRTDKAHYLTTSGGAVPAVLFREMMSRALAQTPIVPFDMPIVGAETQTAKDSNSSSSSGDSDQDNKEDKKESQHGHGKGKKK
ncbi:transglycosylase domain-containing protein [Paenibacillus sp. Soil724D2]|uniref:transglycosylase domain-containing protein n=1 Tax=Paenibacillus sp. (strain Soil724D2) TaxID=1736392 RepID=UPI000712C517|nr:PBP1A family penicillin-binding protein [Paenibacillus sp. Soil724D2]KRE46662.1 penicillin-binding protein [Paenibacillus sp. Soil724D2]